MKLNPITLLVSGMLLSGSVAADQSFTALGRVIASTPVYKTIQIERENHRCRRNNRSNSGYSNFSHRSAVAHIDKTMESVKSSTFADSVKHTRHGHSNIHQKSRHNRHNHGSDRCDTRSHFETKRVLKGFDVTYRYKGDTFHTFTKQRPGRRISLNISISPHF